MGSVADNVLLFESPLTKAPYERLRKGFKSGQRLVERDFSALASALPGTSPTSSASVEGEDPESAISSIDAMISRIETLKRKLGSIQESSMAPMQQSMRARTDHLLEMERIDSPSSSDYARWTEVRMDRWLVDSMLRSGRFKSAMALAKAKDLEPLVDVQIFAEIEQVKTALEHHRCTEALAWCADNKIALRKAKSTLEFDLRLQEFIELVRAENFFPAIAYSKKHLVQWHDIHPQRFRQAMGLLAFKSPSSSTASRNLAIKKFYDPERWNALAKMFTETAYGLTSVSSTPLLSLALYAGLAALKHPDCNPSPPRRQESFHDDSDSESEDHNHQQNGLLLGRNPDCPVCDSMGLGALALEVPSSQHLNSRLVCALSGKIMDDNNPPLAFSNGNIYSRQALEEIASHNDGFVTCPRSGVVMKFSDLRKVFVT